MLAAAALLVVPLAACTASDSARLDAGGRTGSEFGATEGSAPGDSAESRADESTSDGASANAEQALIRTGYVSIEVGDPAEAAKSTAEIAERLDGQVESQSVSRANAGDAARAQLTLRVPAERFDDAIEELSEVGDVISQEASAVDVTAEYVDLQARVHALEASVERLTELMSGSASTGELIEAESALSQRQQELDGLQAQLDALEGQVDLATIEVSLSSEAVIPGGGPSNFWEGLVAGFQSLLGAGSGALVVLGLLLPWLIVAGVIALVVIAIVRRATRRRRRRSAPVAAQGQVGDGAATAPEEQYPEPSAP